METKGSLPCSQKHATGPYLEQGPASRWFLALLSVWPRRQGLHVPPKHSLTLNRPNSVISQKTGLFMTTAVSSLHPRSLFL
jgi:hypothetical protein